MKKYKLINLTTKQETICDKVVVDGFDYYVSDENRIVGNFYIGKGLSGNNIFKWDSSQEEKYPNQNGKVIATNNPDLDLPKVAELLDYQTNKYSEITEEPQRIIGFALGYNKSQETHPYSASDMIEFAEWKVKNGFYMYSHEDKWSVKSFSPYYTDANESVKIYTTQELLQIWEEQRPKIVYYE